MIGLYILYTIHMLIKYRSEVCLRLIKSIDKNLNITLNKNLTKIK